MGFGLQFAGGVHQIGKNLAIGFGLFPEGFALVFEGADFGVEEFDFACFGHFVAEVQFEDVGGLDHAEFGDVVLLKRVHGEWKVRM